MKRYILGPMRRKLRLWFVLVGAIFSIVFPPEIQAQCPRASEGRLVLRRTHATLPDEMKDMQKEAEREEASHPKVRVEDVTIEGAPDLEESIRALIDDRLLENGFESDSD
jgi:hypothetical protein